MYTQYKKNQERPAVALEPAERETLLDHVDNTQTLRVRYTVRTLMHTGLRVAELAHMNESWLDGPSLHEIDALDWESFDEWPMVRVPGYQPCRCNYCKTQAAQHVSYAEDEPDDGDDGYKEAVQAQLHQYWKPKSVNSERQIPVFEKETWRVMSEHLDEVGETQVTTNALWKRVKKAGSVIDFNHELTCHSLRHTYGTRLAENGVPVDTIKRLMGHGNSNTTELYIDMTGQQVASQAAEYLMGQ